MLELTTKASLAIAARTLAESYELVQHGTTTFIPVSVKTGAQGPCPASECVWMPLSRDDKRRMANGLSKILFANDSEITNFDLMLRQFSEEKTRSPNKILVRTESGLQILGNDGRLYDPQGTFYPNFIQPMLNTDPDDKAFVMGVLEGWLNSADEAHSLLYHLSTSLSPGWSAVKYVLLIGDGRNGKSVLLSMLADLFGQHNVSNVTRQQMSERLPVCTELNSKLLNIIYDGEMAYLKDSSMEKTLIAGEPGFVRMLYENGTTRVQTKALFLEALNREPKTRDKSSALQKRLSRFFFPNVYSLDHKFEKTMRSEQYLGAFLALLIDHFVEESDLADKLKQTDVAVELQVEQQLLNSPLLQFMEFVVGSDPSWIEKFEKGGLQIEPLINSFMAWRIQEGYNEYSSADVKRMFRELFTTRRASVRVAGKVVKRDVLGSPKPETQALLDQLKGEEDGVQPETLVDDDEILRGHSDPDGT